MLQQGLVKKEIEQWNMYLDYNSQVNMMNQDYKTGKEKKVNITNWYKGLNKVKKAAAYQNLLADIEYIEKIIKKKVEITESIYNLIQSICKDNRENEKYTYNLLHNFLFQAQHLQSATDCIISITGDNEELLEIIGNELIQTSDDDLVKELGKFGSHTIYSGDRQEIANVVHQA